MKIDTEIPEDVKKRYNDMMKIRESRRTQEEIISDIIVLIKDIKKDSFLPLVMEMINHIDQRNTSDVFKYLMSPMKQLVYLIDLFYSVENLGTKNDISKNEWMQVTKLLNEVEMTYFGDIGFFNEGTNEGIDFDKTSVSLLAFLDYFGNAQLSYDEQTLERFERICGNFDLDVKNLFGFTVSDAITFCYHIRRIINQKLTDCNYYMLHEDEWQKLTQKFIERGITDARLWWDEPELRMLKEYRANPGYVFIHSENEIKDVNLPSETVDRLIEFLCYPDVEKSVRTIYYADKNQYFDTPIIRLNEQDYLCPYYKFLIESLYNRVNAELIKVKGEKYSQYKNQMLEKKVIEIFMKLFGKDVLIFKSYYFDKAHSEQDILIRFKQFCFIVEVKDCLFRAPMRDPIKGYEKIKSDFKKSIQNGYDQCKRVEDKIAEGIPFKIYDIKTNKFLYELIPNRIDNYFSIVVTQFKYGGIQANLESLLVKNPDDLYPWSICVDDLEAFVLMLKKSNKSIAASQFVEFIKHRESYHEHLVCSDELELCGFFINDKQAFIEQSDSMEIITTFAGMSDMFDAEYKNGLGFENELDINIKKHYKVPEYSKSYTASIINGHDLVKQNEKASP